MIVPHLSEAFKRCIGMEQINLIHLKSVLTNREIEVLNWLKLGKTSWEVSLILNVSERTIYFHTNNIIKKLNAGNRTHAVAIACTLGIIDIN
jgi:DNA-binding CsgD family transcriptional regulator